MALRAEKVLFFPSTHSCSPPDYETEIRNFATRLTLSYQGLSLVSMTLAFEGKVLETALTMCSGNVAEAASRLGMSEQDLRYELDWRFPGLESQVSQNLRQLKRVADYLRPRSPG